jgi:hypothetical protein
VNRFHTICTQYNQIWTNQQFKTLFKSTPRTHDLTRGSATTTKVSYSSLRSLQRARSFPTLTLHKPTTKVKTISSQLSSTSEWYKLLGVVHKFGDSQATFIHQGTQGSKSNKSIQDSSLRWAREMKRKGESRWNQRRVRPTSPHTKGPSINWRRCDFGCERWIECSCLRVGQQINYGEGRSEWRERVWGVYKGAPKGGSRWGILTENWLNRFWNRLNRFPLGWFSVHWLAQPESGPVPKPVEPAQKPVEPVFQQSVHDFSDMIDWQSRKWQSEQCTKTGWAGFWNRLNRFLENWREPWGSLSGKW